MKEIVINSFNEYVEYTEKYKSKFLFRGQSNVDWGIKPSIFRDEQALKDEVENIQESLKESEKNVLLTLFELQHYGSPTRLLDLTISPLSALFFSVDSEGQCENDGVVWIGYT